MTERVERRLAAILAADVAGYSRLIGVDEEGTLAALRAMRRDIIDSAIAAHRGRIVKTTGDGVLAEFQSVVDAVRCAAAWQAAVPADDAIQWRIGVHQGDIVVEDDDIFGDGVNIAARLEGIAEPGGICVSARVHEDVAGRLDLAFEDLGEQKLKNIARPVRAFRTRFGIQTMNTSTVSRIRPLGGWLEVCSWFSKKGQPVGATVNGRGIALNDAPALWFRMGPLPGAQFHKYGAQIKTALGQNAPILLPLRFYVGESSWLITNDGFYLYHTPHNGSNFTDMATFIFESGEIWGIDTLFLENRNVLHFAHTDLIKAFQNFTAVLNNYLQVPAPYRWQIGMEQLRGRRLLMTTQFGELVPRGQAYSVETLDSEGIFKPGDSPYSCLRPFFEKLIARAGLDPDENLKGLPSD